MERNTRYLRDSLISDEKEIKELIEKEVELKEIENRKVSDGAGFFQSIKENKQKKSDISRLKERIDRKKDYIKSKNDEIKKYYNSIKKAEGEIERSDLVLFMTDASGNLDEEDIDILRKLNNKTCIAILNKTDKGIVLNEHIIKDISDIPVIQMSIKEKTGINELKEKIKELFIKEEIRNDEIYITNKRQEELFRKAYNSLMMVNNSIDDNMSEDVYTVDLMDAYFFLGEIIGEDISDDLADRIFSEFCMGK